MSRTPPAAWSLVTPGTAVDLSRTQGDGVPIDLRACTHLVQPAADLVKLPPSPAASATAEGIARHPKTKWVFVVSGFRQDPGQPTGSQALWAALHAHHNGPSTVVTFLPWNTNWAAIAEQVRMCSNGHLPQVFVAAYSWGAGWGFVRLAKEMRKRGLRIQSAVLSDPVYRHPLWSLAWLALVRWRKIMVPNNVNRVHWFFQREGLPRGHRVVAQDAAKTIVFDGQQLPDGVTHAFADESLEYHQTALKEFS